MTEVTKDEDTKTNVFVESQTIKYALNPEAFKQDLEKAKNEITDMGNVVENTVNPKGLDKRNILENLRAQRGGTTLYNVVGSRVEALDKAFKDGIINEEEYKEAVRKVIKGYGKDIGVDFEVVYLDEKTMPKDAKGSTGSAFINKETEKMLEEQKKKEEEKKKLEEQKRKEEDKKKLEEEEKRKKEEEQQKQEEQRKQEEQKRQEKEASESIEIHANIKSKIYHMPGQAHYNRISSKNLVIFHSEQEAINAGYRKAKK